MTPEGPKWYGVNRNGTTFLYRNLENDFIGVFESLAEGTLPELSDRPAKRVPDLRSLLISYGEYRVRKTFTQDQILRKIRMSIPDLDSAINQIYERVLGLMPVIDHPNVDTSEPCSFFNSLKGSSGMPEHLSHLVEAGSTLCNTRSKIHSSLREEIRKLMPNTCELAGEDISLALLAEAGSLRALAEMPGSGIQVLGADTALFKHLTAGTPPPKHGVIFKFPGITSLPKKLRGKASRVAANQISICARADYLGRRIDVRPLKEKIKKAMSLRE
ncbi:hypothetical protein ApAK_03375 [Thermoplasmatales archaeon AK]|nr:hypothetical protein [Thermoplasmatales archaeon AK]